MTDQIFSDGIGQVSVIGGMVRLDFVAYSPTEKDAKGQPVPVLCQRVIMSADSFLRAAEKIQEAGQAIAKLAPRPREVQIPEAMADVSQPTPVQPEPPNPSKRPFP